MIPLSVRFLLCEGFRREGATLVPMLIQAKQRVIAANAHFATIKVMQWLAMCLGRAGRLRESYQESRAALELLEQSGGHVTIIAGYFQWFLAHMFYSWNDLAASRSLAERLVRDARDWQQVDIHVVAYGVQIALDLAEGALEQAAKSAAAVADALTIKCRQALRQTGLTRLAVGGGVSANKRLRQKLGAMCAGAGVELFIPPMSLCTDNAAMAALAVEKWKRGEFAPPDLDAEPNFV